MPIKGKGKRRIAPRRKRAYRKKYRKSPITRSLGYCFPQRLKISLPYVESVITCSATAANSEWVWRGNNIFDPYFTSTGHQPLYFDQLAAIYNTYYVSGSTFKVIIASTDSAATTGAGRFLVVPTNDSTNLNATYTFNTILEQEHGKRGYYSQMGGKNDTAISKSRMSTRKMLTAPGRTSYNANGGVTGTGPTDAWWWHLIISSMNDSATINNTFRVMIVYDCEFSERKSIQAS